MVGWQRHLQSILRQTGKRLECSCNGSFSSSPYHSKASLVMGDMPFLRNLQNSTSPSFSSPLYQYLQQLGFTSSSKVLADSSEASPIPSPLTPVLALNSGKTEAQKAVSKPSNVQAILKGIKQHVTRASRGLEPYFKRDASQAGLLEMRPFGKTKSILGHQTLQLMRRPYGVKESMYVVTGSSQAWRP
ncbi:unnamed protein product [Ilex paraguariensis]|uniref:Uncharacterized protein n=1 Tax=Ilex paraguariensis TaxID=185542 RepID=A0ABC8TFN0_9AQUA